MEHAVPPQKQTKNKVLLVKSIFLIFAFSLVTAFGLFPGIQVLPNSTPWFL